ncbi:patatin-like phospholipase family protein [Rhodoplanes sp. TEM]|uniref:Patatin-like phospholipase family protein n=1 Tax=Rhodoplanes tepidamans TaxID=200616 RepID=A0ABT5JD25_RHOTP|nr:MULTISPECIES: patatin-like phospholipase family protein [Rhodoplanes]MDC7787569.1 patatin-like phospholipase family protein [Rhodoplanes tepidamans]MDC7984938.1 patatin-like phospholipase family protein [Rhodoplanes sp. TEM]MDQ0357998.1 NTE family protein [Rhodoplanes tepidamans]
MSEPLPAHNQRKPVALALQGGGAHGAYAWGVVDALLEDERLAVEAVSATSAGAMNAVLLADGLVEGGPARAREKLAAFWRAVSCMEAVFGLAWSAFDRLAQAVGLPPEYMPSHAAVHALTHSLPPDLLNPFRFNPLRRLLLEHVDFDRVNDAGAIRLYLNATNVRTGKIALFETPQITVETVLASCCLPPYFQAVEIGGEHYWDGGFLGNPAIYPLVYRDGARDVIVVQVGARARPELPRTAAEVLHRMNEISFNSSLVREMRAIAFVTQLIDAHELDAEKHHRMFMHWIGDDATMAELGGVTQFHPDWGLLSRLRDAGRAAAAAWLADNADAVGRRSTLDVAGLFL